MVQRRVLVYFTAIGFGFIVVEIILAQKFVLFLGHPFHALATILCSLLLFARRCLRYAHGRGWLTT